MVKIYHRLYALAFRSEAGDYLRKNPLHFTILLEMMNRAWWEDAPNKDGLKKWECTLSTMEYEKFWLKLNQKWKIGRSLQQLKQKGYISKIDRKLGNEHSNIYKVLPNEIIQAGRMSETDTGNELSKTGTDIDTKKESTNKELKKSESTPPENSLSPWLQTYISYFKKIIESKWLFRNGKDNQDYEYMKKLLGQPELLAKICQWMRIKSDDIDMVMKKIAWLIWAMITEKKFWKGKLSNMKSIYDNLPQVFNEFLSL